MKRSKIWGLISLGVWATALGIIAYWSNEIGGFNNLGTWDYEYKFFALYLFIAGFIPLGIAGYYSHKEGDRFDWSKV